MRDRLRIAIDMDEVIADTIQKFVDVFKAEHNFDIITQPGKEIAEVMSEDLAALKWQYIDRPGFFRDIPVIADSQEVVKALCEKYDVYIVSAAMEFRHSFLDKYEWLEEYFPFIPWTNIIFCGHKIVDVDIMIDDRIKNFVGFEDRKLLYTSPHNLLLTDYERVSTWKEVAAKLL